MEEIKETTDQTLLGWYRDFMEQLSKLDSEAIEDARRRFPEMAKTWREIFKPEIDEWIGDAVNAAVNTAVNNNKRTIYFESVQDGEMRIDYAARKSGVSVADFTDSMKKAGYKIPQHELV